MNGFEAGAVDATLKVGVSAVPVAGTAGRGAKAAKASLAAASEVTGPDSARLLVCTSIADDTLAFLLDAACALAIGGTAVAVFGGTNAANPGTVTETVAGATTVSGGLIRLSY